MWAERRQQVLRRRPRRRPCSPLRHRACSNDNDNDNDVAGFVDCKPDGRSALPATGDESGRIAIIGLALIGFGLTLMGLRRRSRVIA
jgi:LPXTG-motif cell wall-anchored protein